MQNVSVNITIQAEQGCVCRNPKRSPFLGQKYFDLVGQERGRLTYRRQGYRSLQCLHTWKKHQCRQLQANADWCAAGVIAVTVVSDIAVVFSTDGV